MACGTLADPPRKSGAAAAFVAWRLRFASSWRFAAGKNCCRTVAPEAPQRASRFGAVGPLRRSWRLGGAPVLGVLRGPAPLHPRGWMVGPCGPCAASRGGRRLSWGGLGGRAGGSLVVFKPRLPVRSCLVFLRSLVSWGFQCLVGQRRKAVREPGRASAWPPGLRGTSIPEAVFIAIGNC